MTNTFAKTITKNTTNQTLYGAGLGFRRELLFQLQQADLSLIDFLKCLLRIG